MADTTRFIGGSGFTVERKQGFYAAPSIYPPRLCRHPPPGIHHPPEMLKSYLVSRNGTQGFAAGR